MDRIHALEPPFGQRKLRYQLQTEMEYTPQRGWFIVKHETTGLLCIFARMVLLLSDYTALLISVKVLSNSEVHRQVQLTHLQRRGLHEQKYITDIFPHNLQQ